MQIDFHHAATYVIARFAGFPHKEAATIGHAAQYVDDATNSGTILFENGAMYHRISSAHKMLDYRNFKVLANHRVWIPFHFLPGNDGLPAGQEPSGGFIEKLICRPNSHIAKDMVRACIQASHLPYALHRLGITMHVYADTWAHQGFAGVNNKVNDIQALDDQDQPDGALLSRLTDFFGDRLDQMTSKFVGDALPLGHGAVLSYPDRPYLKWSYRDHKNEKVSRDNPKDFMEAAQEMCKVMQCYRAKDPDADVPGLAEQDQKRFERLIRNIKFESGGDRHKEWLRHISEGYFSFGAVSLDYLEKGEGSWKHEALKTEAHTDKPGHKFFYSPSFLNSDWKLFHDAIQAHRFCVLHDILPRYGICAA